ncbi:MAG: DUF1647 domain-containing protein [Gracilimonas sp.]|uniref:DUF1647 domain-containing protein n=1 Tax=Gracilimonas TaxID=649462 RepID=UPI001B21FFC9|nr:DUF1647 domain-containing protein [Gracilimonas sp.]MBO6584716.1 DUF1647 domain-containing protein [Gracilimonas sp.]MBO6616013.1 DUF1647 domain-containing protein [Gracilimonas sp.]
MGTNPNYIISAADERYFRSFLQLYHSYIQTEEFNNSGFIFYDIGLNSEQRVYLKELQSKSSHNFISHKFGFENYPEFVKLKYKTYSWKPIIIQEVINQKEANILWLDSANIILKNLKSIWNVISETGSYVPFSGSGTLDEWTVQETLDYMNVPQHWYGKRNRAGNTCGFSHSNKVIKEVIEKWRELALIKECIKPEGANRSNHRDDQSLLSILLMEAAEKDNLTLTDDEVDISSWNPTSFISVRNFVSPSIPESLNVLTIPYFKVVRQIDMLINRLF